MIAVRSGESATRKCHVVSMVLMSVMLLGASITTVLSRSASAVLGHQAYSHQIGSPAIAPTLWRSALAPDGSIWVIDRYTPRLFHTSATGQHLVTVDVTAGSHFTYLASATTSSDGSVYTLDDSGLVQHFSSAGVFISSFTLQGGLNALDFSLDASGNFYVVAGNQVKKYDSSGTQLAVWGTTSASSANGQFSYPSGVAIDASGNVYVADTQNDRIQVFDATGAFLRSWAVDRPYDVTVDNAGKAYAISYGTSEGRVVQVNNATTGVLLRTVTIADTASNGTRVRGISVSPDGSQIFINDELVMFRLDANFTVLATYDVTGSPVNGLYAPSKIAQDRQGNIYVYDSYHPNGRQVVNKYTQAGTFIAEIPLNVSADDGAGNSYSTEFSGLFQIDAAGNFYFFGHPSVSTANGETTYYNVTKYASTGGEPTFLIPNSDSNYSLYATAGLLDPISGEILMAGNASVTTNGVTHDFIGARFNTDGSHMRTIGDPDPPYSSGGIEYHLATSVTIAPDDSLYFTSAVDWNLPGVNYWSVWKTDHDGHNRTPLIPYIKDEGTIRAYTNPYDLSFDPNGTLYISGQISTISELIPQCVVATYTTAGVYQDCIVNQGTDLASTSSTINGRFIVDQYGNLFVLDIDAHVVKMYLIPTDAPSAPRNLEVDPTATSLAIRWDPPLSDGNTLITNYLVRYRVTGTIDWITAATVDSTARSYTLTGLRTNTSYEIAVIARNSAGESPLAQLTSTTARTLRAPNTGVALVDGTIPLLSGIIAAALLAAMFTLLPIRRRAWRVRRLGARGNRVVVGASKGGQ